MPASTSAGAVARPGGTHSCLTTQSAAGFLRRGLRFLADGIARDERLVYVSGRPADVMRSDVAGLGPTSELEAAGALTLVSYADADDLDALVVPERQLEVFAAATTSAVQHGHAGLRVLAELTGLAAEPRRRAALLRYEHLATRYMSDHPMSALCALDRAVLDDAALAELAAVHPRAEGTDASTGFRLLPAVDGLRLTGAVDAWDADRLEHLLQHAHGPRQRGQAPPGRRRRGGRSRTAHARGVRAGPRALRRAARGRRSATGPAAGVRRRGPARHGRRLMPRRGATVHLAGERRSVGAARRFLDEVVAGRLGEDDLDTATLLVTEVVTNAVLHAHTDVAVHVAVEGQGLLVQVDDGSPAAPHRREHDEEAVFGRGLELVEHLADEYGVLANGGGKTVWFTLGGAAVPGPNGWREVVHGVGSSLQVRLTGLPVELAGQLARHNETLLREYELHCSGPSADPGTTTRVADAARAREIIAAAVERARAAIGADPGRSAVDVDLDVPTADLASFSALVDVLGDAERLAAAGALLSRPADARLSALLDWTIGEVLAQVSGGQPVAWPQRRRAWSDE